MEVATSRFRMPVGEMLQRVSNYELNHWMALQAMDPSGESRADLRTAICTSALANVQITGRKKTKVKDFLAGEWIRKGYEKSAAERGVTKAWNAKKWWSNLLRNKKG